MMTAETEKRASRCCFTGHRPEKLHISEYAVKERLGQAIDIAIDRGKTVFICGMARGVDLWAGQAVAERKKENPLVRLICATPVRYDRPSTHFFFESKLMNRSC